LTVYDPRWPETFAALRDQIAAVLGPLARRIEHIGSTAVPGLSAKPIIDLDVVIAIHHRPGRHRPGSSHRHPARRRAARQRWRTVSLYDVLPSIDRRNASLVVGAVAHAARHADLETDKKYLRLGR
jgi:hypothetical protein